MRDPGRAREAGVCVIARSPVAAGFALAGVPSVAVREPAEAAERIAALRAAGEVGIVLLEEELYDALPARARRELERTPLPAIVPVPGPSWVRRPAAEEYVVELLRRAVGYRVRLG